MKLVAKIFVALVCLSLSANSFACSCAGFTLDEQIESAENIAFAVLVEAHIEDDSFGQVIGTFKVHEILKGEITDILEISTGADFGVGCGVRLTIGLHYLLFFNSATQKINSCNGSGEYTKEKLDAVREKLHGS